MVLDRFFSHITIIEKQLLPLFNVFGSDENYAWLGFKDIDGWLQIPNHTDMVD
jgi:hypothetical protein